MNGKYFNADSDKVFVFIHGYTGGPTDFDNLPEFLHRRFSASSICQLLPGHGTNVEKLYGFAYDDLFGEVEHEVKKLAASGKKVVLVGLSLGAQVALHIAAKHKVCGVIAIGISHDLKFPFNIPGLGLLGLFKKTWNKNFTPSEKKARADAIYYDQMPADGLHLSRRLRKLVTADAAMIDKPVMFIHSSRDRLCSPAAAAKLCEKIPAKTEVKIIDCAVHSMFFSDMKNKITEEIVSFIERKNLFSDARGSNSAEKASAIIPAFNEADRIGAVISELLKVPHISEVIVIDDGSNDNTAEAAGKFTGVKVIRNEKNIGKGASLDKAVQVAKNELLFFCDADLIGFKARHAESIIEPVLNGVYDMFIGMRGNFMQKTVRAWALNSGERALRKEIWQKLPDYYKHRYRVEVGLNHYVKNFTNRGFGAKVFDYAQPVKESKYGIVRGTILRWWMNFDVLKAYGGHLF